MQDDPTQKVTGVPHKAVCILHYYYYFLVILHTHERHHTSIEKEVIKAAASEKFIKWNFIA